MNNAGRVPRCRQQNGRISHAVNASACKREYSLVWTFYGIRAVDADMLDCLPTAH
jgi:hypothetical protein